ncbi:MAG: hypothetical protein AB1714_28420 [Acidobacteriota bacterium]
MNDIVSLVAAHRFKIIIAVLLLFCLYRGLRRIVLFGRAGWRKVAHRPGYASEPPGGHFFWACIWFALVAAAGFLIVFALVLDTQYEPVGGASRVGTLTCDGRSVHLKPAEAGRKPASRVSLTARQWAVRGTFLTFGQALQYAGLRDSHRVQEVVGRDRPAIPDEARVLGRLAPVEPIFSFIHRFDRYIPLLETRVVTSPYLDRAPGTWTLFAFGGGYSFASPAGPRK